MKKQHEASFADIVCDLRVRKIKRTFFHQMDLLIDWRKVSNVINKHITIRKSEIEKRRKS